MKTLKWLASLIVGGVIVALASKITIDLLVPARPHAQYSNAAIPPPEPPLSANCTLQTPALADCTVVLSGDPAAYGATVAGAREELLQEWCTGLARRTDGERGDANVHVLYPDRTSYAEFQLKADECR